MAKSNKLRSNLRAADRRRRRRQAVPERPAASSTPSRVDVAGMMVELILESCDGSERTDDAIALAALRATKRGTAPQGHQAETLYQRLVAISDRPDVSDRQFIAAVDQLLEQSESSHRDSQVQNPFTKFLAMLAS